MKNTSFLKQISILTWKNYLLTKQNWIGFLIETFVSIFFAFLLLIVRNFVEIFHFPSQSYPSYSLIDFFYKAAGQDLVLFYPDSPIIKNIVNRAFRLIKSQKYWLNITLKGTNISEAIDLDFQTANRLLAYISFPSYYDTSIPDNIFYTITTKEQNEFVYKVNENLYEKQEYLFRKSPEELCHDNKTFRLYNVFNSIKHSIDLSIIQEISKIPMNDPKQIKIQPIDCPEYFNDELKSSFGFIIPLIIEISFMFTLLINIGIIVREKQTKMKEYLKIIGIRSNIYWISSILRSFFIYFILTILITIIGYIELNPKRSDSRLLSKSLFRNTHFTVIFASLFIYSIQTSIFTLLLSQFFARPFMAKLFSILIWLLTAINFYNYLISSGLKYFLCFFPNVGLIYIFQIINQYERSNYMKLDFMKIFSNLYDQNDTNIGVILVLMIVFSFVYIPMIWYFEKIMPAQFGISLPFYFIFLPSYWKNKFNYKKLYDESNFLKNDFNFNDNIKNIFYENDPNYLNQIIKLKNLTKKYRNGFKNKIAVKNLNINLYENQINGFLGHNGAGKTTLLFMLCGIYPTSSGEAIIMDYNLMTNVNKIRSLIGFCPQSPILYDDLTVYEHLYLIASVCSQFKRETDRIV